MNPYKIDQIRNIELIKLIKRFRYKKIETSCGEKVERGYILCFVLNF